jgi:hypothetical protein
MLTPVYVQGNSADPQAPQSTVTVSYTPAQVAGDLNVVVVGWKDTTATINSVVDRAGNVDTRSPFDVGSTGSGSATITMAPDLLVGTGMIVGPFKAAGSG